MSGNFIWLLLVVGSLEDHSYNPNFFIPLAFYPVGT